MMTEPMVPKNLDLWKLLLKDWTQCLEGLEKQILRLEVLEQDQELIGDLAARLRRIKRGSAYAGLAVMTRMAHGMERALSAIRERRVEVNATLIDQLLSAAEALHDCLNQLGGRLREPDLSWWLDGVPAFEPEREAQWDGAVQQLHAFLDQAEKAEEGETDPPGGAAHMLERFLAEIHDLMDRITNEIFARLDRDAEDRGAWNDLHAAVFSMGRRMEEFRASLPPDSVLQAHLTDLLDAVRPFEQWIAWVLDENQPLTEDLLVLGREAAGHVQAALEAAAMGLESGGSDGESGGAEFRGDLAEKTAARDAEPQAKPAGEPAQRAAMTQSIRVSQDKLDKMMNMISELLIAKNAFMHLSARLNVEYDLPKLSKEVKEVGFSLHRISDELQNTIMSIRMVEIKTVFQKMPRIVRDVAQLTGKKMELEMTGETTEIDKTIVEQISDPLVHLIRNAADHGIEGSQDRLRKGKPETGRIVLRAYNKDKHVYIEIEDDGQGIDPEVVKRKALERGVITAEQADKMAKSQLINLIFLPGFSTASRITEVSGRGVGMDIVKNNIEKINGSILVESEKDKGTKVVIRLPLTLAISRGLIVDVMRETFIIPIDAIAETVKIDRRDIHEFQGKFFAALHGEVIGIEWMSRLFLLGDRNLDGQEPLNAVIVSNGEEKFGLIVDRLRNEQEFVIKTLEGHLAGTPGISGSTLLGDGHVVLIVNPLDLIQLAKSEDVQEALCEQNR